MLKEYQRLKDKNEYADNQYNMMQFQQKLRENEQWRNYLDKIDERNYNAANLNRQTQNNLALNDLEYTRRKGDLQEARAYERGQVKDQRDWQHQQQREAWQHEETLYDKRLKQNMEIWNQRAALQYQLKNGNKGAGKAVGEAVYQGVKLPYTQWELDSFVNWLNKPNADGSAKAASDVQALKTAFATNNFEKLKNQLLNRYIDAYMQDGGVLGGYSTAGQPTAPATPAAPANNGGYTDPNYKPTAPAAPAAPATAPATKQQAKAAAPATKPQATQQPTVEARAKQKLDAALQSSPRIKEQVEKYGYERVLQSYISRETQQ